LDSLGATDHVVKGGLLSAAPAVDDAEPGARGLPGLLRLGRRWSQVLGRRVLGRLLGLAPLGRHVGRLLLGFVGLLDRGHDAADHGDGVTLQVLTDGRLVLLGALGRSCLAQRRHQGWDRGQRGFDLEPQAGAPEQLAGAGAGEGLAHGVVERVVLGGPLTAPAVLGAGEHDLERLRVDGQAGVPEGSQHLSELLGGFHDCLNGRAIGRRPSWIVAGFCQPASGGWPAAR